MTHADDSPLPPAAAVERVKELLKGLPAGPWECEIETEPYVRDAQPYAVIHGAVPHYLKHQVGFPVADTMNAHHCLDPDEHRAIGAFIAESRTLLPQLAAEVERQAGEIERLRAALKRAAETFRGYERMHLEKMTTEGAVKAAANAARAAECETALSGEEGA